MFHRTERLFLRPTFAEDWQAIYDGIAEERIVRNLATAPWPYTEQHAKAFVQLQREAHLPNFSITRPGTGVVGQCGLGIDGDTGLTQIGYWIARAHWGQGYATEAAAALLKIARTLGHRTLAGSHFVDNPASGKVLRKVGFRPTGVVRPGSSLARKRRDPVVCYEISLDEDQMPEPLKSRRLAA